MERYSIILRRAEMTPEQAKSFATEWIESWNSCNLDAILSHYDEYVEWSSACTPAHSGLLETLHGKKQVRAYWGKCLEEMSHLRLELLEVVTGDSSITICYRTPQDKFIADVLFFNEKGKVLKAVTMSHETP